MIVVGVCPGSGKLRPSAAPTATTELAIRKPARFGFVVREWCKDEDPFASEHHAIPGFYRTRGMAEPKRSLGRSPFSKRYDGLLKRCKFSFGCEHERHRSLFEKDLGPDGRRSNLGAARLFRGPVKNSRRDRMILTSLGTRCLPLNRKLVFLERTQSSQAPVRALAKRWRSH